MYASPAPDRSLRHCAGRRIPTVCLSSGHGQTAERHDPEYVSRSDDRESRDLRRRFRTFVAHLPVAAPPLARITNFDDSGTPLSRRVLGGRFRLSDRLAARAKEVRTLISPDVAILPGLPARKCSIRMTGAIATHSSIAPTAVPRFTIIRDIPYDRPSTSMAMFADVCGLP
jgi:hydrogenase maturation factor HypF (carbamoyltransferase family)